MRKAKVEVVAFDAGFDAGYTDGSRLGREGYGTLLEGTSIIIPTYNKVEYLRMCLESIAEHTPEPHEIIVVDNASKDHTARYLNRLCGKVRYRIMPENRGFAGAVNAGLMMAKGRTILLLNNDTIVTPRWLSGLLACLNSDERIGMVGPVTNNIGGPQRIEVPYTKAADMPSFAAGHNLSDAAKWTDTDRLVGFCLLFRRELLERTGYLDEGFRIGNYEDDDYGLRVRLQGFRLVIAGDTFIHHFGSVSMKELGARLHAVNEGNKAFYARKWGQPAELHRHVTEITRQTAVRAETDFYPGQAAVRAGGTAYWLEDGVKRPLSGEPLRIPVTPVSRIALRLYVMGEPIDAFEAEERWLAGWSAGSPADRIGDEGGDSAELQPSGLGVATGSDGRMFLLEGGVRRWINGTSALEAWGLGRTTQITLTEQELADLPEGLPVIAPPQTWKRL